MMRPGVRFPSAPPLRFSTSACCRLCFWRPTRRPLLATPDVELALWHEPWTPGALAVGADRGGVEASAAFTRPRGQNGFTRRGDLPEAVIVAQTTKPPSFESGSVMFLRRSLVRRELQARQHDIVGERFLVPGWRIGRRKRGESILETVFRQKAYVGCDISADTSSGWTTSSTSATWLHHVEGLARPDTSKLGDRASSASMSINR